MLLTSLRIPRDVLVSRVTSCVPSLASVVAAEIGLLAQSDRAPLRPRFGHGQEQHKREQELGGGTFVNVFGERLGLGLGTCVPFSSPAES